MTRIDYKLEYPLVYLNLIYLSEKKWYLGEDMEIVLSDGRTIIIPKGFETDLSSIPEFVWGLFKPFDKGLLGDLIHDYLWTIKEAELAHFGTSKKARKWSDEERLRWRKKLAKEFKIKNYITHLFLRIFGKSVYIGKRKLK
jgi:hypothetical protein